MDWIATDADIRAAYRIILRRDADDAGLQHYRELSRSHGLTVRHLADEMTASAEYRHIQAARLKVVEVAGVDDVRVVVDSTEREFGRHIARFGIWEPHIVRQIRRLLRPGDVFVDIGANVGMMSFIAAKQVGPSGQVVAFEPNPDNIQRFLEGMKVNRLANVRLLPFGASDQHGVFALQGGSNTYLSNLSNLSDGGALCQVYPADRFLSALDRVDFIKIDIEGHEPLALKGLSETIGRHRPTMLCEFNPRCLQDYGAHGVEEFAAGLFDLFDQVTVIDHDEDMMVARDVDALMDFWRVRDRQEVERGALSPGMLHFDLLLAFDR